MFIVVNMTCYFCLLAQQILSLFSLVDSVTIQEQRMPREKNQAPCLKQGLLVDRLCSQHSRECPMLHKT